MEKIFISAFEDMILGGGETYYFRMVSWFEQNGYISILLIPIDSSISSNVVKEIMKYNITIYKYSEHRMIPEICLVRLKQADKIIGIVSSIERYYLLQRVLKSKENVKLFFYVLSWGRGVLRFDGIITRVFFRILLSPLIKSKAFIALDEETQQISCTYSMISAEKVPIVRNGVASITIKKREQAISDSHKILSVCRFDFPFKGYILGLIKDFGKIAADNKKLELIIVGYGRGYDEVKNECLKLSPDIRRRINLLGDIPYSELGKVYQEATVYVGMGTTVLEASSHGVVSIVAATHQRENYCLGYFGQSLSLGGPVEGRFSNYLDVTLYKKHTFIELIEKILILSPDQYSSIVDSGYEALDKFDIDRAMHFFLDSNYGIVDKTLNANIQSLAIECVIVLRKFVSKIKGTIKKIFHFRRKQ